MSALPSDLELRLIHDRTADDRRRAEERRRAAALRPDAPRRPAAPRGPVRIVVADPSRRTAVLAFLRTLSPQTSYRRFVTPAPPTGVVDLDVMLATDAGHRAVVALDGDEVVGHAMAVASADRGTVELAVVVADDRQGQGIGQRLVAALLDAEPVASAHELELLVLAWNAPARRLVTRIWPGVLATREGELIHYRVRTRVAAATAGMNGS